MIGLDADLATPAVVDNLASRPHDGDHSERERRSGSADYARCPLAGARYEGLEALRVFTCRSKSAGVRG